MYHMFLLSIIRVRPSPTIFASTQPNYLHIYRISCKITKKERRERSLPCYDSHGLIQHVKRIYNNNNNNNDVGGLVVAVEVLNPLLADLVHAADGHAGQGPR
jgi:hypothetical protein